MDEVSRCKLCSSLEIHPYCCKDAINVVRCLSCGLIYADYTPEINALKDHYSKKYFEAYVKTVSFHTKRRFEKRIREIRKIKPSGTLLDVGAGVGIFLKAAADKGYETKGVELSTWACEYAQSNFRIDIYNGDMSGAGFAPGSFDIITLWHILEHVSDPRAFLSNINWLLKENGLLALELPNIGSRMAIISGANWELMAPKEHLFYFTFKTLEQLLSDVGFGVIKTQTYFWMMPDMLLRAKAESGDGCKRVILRTCAALLSWFSFFRFMTLPRFLEGDVITVYAIKKKDTFNEEAGL